MTVTTVGSRINAGGGSTTTVAPLASPPAEVLGARWIVSDLGNLARVFDGTNFIFEDPFWEAIRKNGMLLDTIVKAFFSDDVAAAFDFNNFSGAGGTINREKGYVEIDQGGGGTTGFHTYSGVGAKTKSLIIANLLLGGTLDIRISLSNTVRDGSTIFSNGYELLLGVGLDILVRRITAGGGGFTILPNHTLGNIFPSGVVGINVKAALFFDGDGDIIKTVTQPEQLGIFYNETTGEVTYADMVDAYLVSSSGAASNFHYYSEPIVWMTN